MSKSKSCYVAIFDRGWGRECLLLPIDYDFWSSGTLMAPTMKINITTILGKYMELELVYMTDRQREVANVYCTSQQNVSRWIKKNLEINKLIQSGKHSSGRLKKELEGITILDKESKE